ncbi:unnamed protein product [Ectocarpus fasciculatus]
MGKLCPHSGRDGMKTRACTMAEMENEEERRAVAGRNGHGRESCGDGIEHQSKAPHPTQPVCKAPPGGVGVGVGAPTVAGAVVGLTAEALATPSVVLDRSGRVAVVEKHLLAFDEVWPADLPALRPLRLNLRRSCGAGRANADVGHSDDNARNGEGQSGGGRFGGPVFLMPMHRRGKGVQGREDELFPEPPRLRRDEDEATINRDRYCFGDQSRRGKMAGAEGNTGGEGNDGSGGRKKWTRCKIAGTGVNTWRWEWSPEAQMMLGKLAIWTGALLVSRTQAVLTGKDEKLFGLGMAGRVVVEGAAYPRCLLIEAYVPASSETSQLYVSVDELERLFRDDPEKMWVGRKEDMVLELVKMLYFDYTLETEEADSALPGGIRFTSYHYSDREPWTCLHARRDSDFDLHWESRKTSAGIGVPGAGLTAGAEGTSAKIGDERSEATEGTRVSAQTNGGFSGEGSSSHACNSGPMHANGTNSNDSNSIPAAGSARRVAGACSAAAACTPDERAVWIIQRLQVRNTQNMLDIDVAACSELINGGGGGGGGGGEPVATDAFSGHPIKSRNTPAAATAEMQEFAAAEAVSGRSIKSQNVPGATAATQGRGGRSTLDATVHSATSRKWHSKRDAAKTRGPRTNAAGPNRAKRKTRVRAFDVRIEEYKEERRHAEEAKEAKLQAWLAIKKRFRGLTLGTVIQVSGRLLTLMVYEFPDQPGNLNVTFTNPRSGATFRLSLGIGAVAAQARHVSVASSPEDWTLGQKRRVIKKVIQKNSKLVLVEEDETRDRVPERPRPIRSEEGLDNAEDLDVQAFSMENDPWNGLSVGGEGVSKHRASGVRQIFCAIRCLGRDSTAAYTHELPTASRGFTLPRNVHQLQQPGPKDHRRGFSLVSARSTHSASIDDARPSVGAAAADSLPGTAVRRNSLASSHGVDSSADDSSKEQTPDGEGQGAKKSRDMAGRAGTYERVARVRIRPRPRRECGRGRR